jgi:ABC-type multidrug transport system fused ATPase/permease subunit
VILVLAVATSAMETLGIAAFFPVFNSLLTEGGQSTGGVLGFTTDIANLLPIDDPIVAASVFLLAVFVAKVGLSIARDVMIARASAKVQYNVKEEIMERYSSAHYQFYLDNKQGALIYVAQVAPNAVRGLLLKGAQGVGFALKIAFFAILLGLIFPVALAAFAALGLLYYGVFHYLAERVSLQIGIGRARAGSEQTVIHNEFLSGIHQIITLRAGRRWLEQFRQENQVHSDLYKKELIWLSIPRQFIEFSAVAMMVGLILVFRALNPDSSGEFLPKLGVMGIGLFQLLPAIASIGRLRMELMSSLPDMELVHQALTDPVPRRKSGHQELIDFKDAIAFQQATFAHKDREVLLDNVNLSFQKGQVTAIVGPSGSGKTTMVNLLLGLFDPSSGAVTVDGTPIRDLTEESWLSKIGYVSQEPFIYHATVADNMRDMTLWSASGA